MRSAHRTMGMEDGSEVGEPVATEPEALSAMLFSSDRNIMVWINLTSEYSGSQCMWALATRISCLSCGGFMPEKQEEKKLDYDTDTQPMKEWGKSGIKSGF